MQLVKHRHRFRRITQPLLKRIRTLLRPLEPDTISPGPWRPVSAQLNDQLLLLELLKRPVDGSLRQIRHLELLRKHSPQPISIVWMTNQMSQNSMFYAHPTVSSSSRSRALTAQRLPKPTPDRMFRRNRSGKLDLKDRVVPRTPTSGALCSAHPRLG